MDYGRFDPHQRQYRMVRHRHRQQDLLAQQLYRRRVAFFTKSRAFDITRARGMLGWEPKVPVREGLARTIEYFRAQLGTPMMAPRASRPKPARASVG